MAGGKGKIHEHPNANTNGFDKNPQNIGNRPISFKKRYKELYNDDDGVIWVDKSAVIERTKDGKEQLGIPLTKRDKVLLKLDRLIANAKNERTSLDAIKFIWEQIDGKASQSLDITSSTTKINFTGKKRGSGESK